MSDNLSVVLHKILDIRVEGREMPKEPQRGEVPKSRKIIEFMS